MKAFEMKKLTRRSNGQSKPQEVELDVVLQKLKISAEMGNEVCFINGTIIQDPQTIDQLQDLGYEVKEVQMKASGTSKWVISWGHAEEAKGLAAVISMFKKAA